MRPEILFPLFGPIQNLKGIGPRLSVLLEKLTGPHVIDVLWHFPRDIIDRRYAPTIESCQPGRVATLTVDIMGHEFSSDRRRPHRITCKDSTGFMTLVFFRGNKKFFESQLPIGETRVVSGKCEKYQNKLQMAHPDYIFSVEENANFPKVEPVYPMSAGITGKTIHKAVEQGLKVLPDLPEWLDHNFITQKKWGNWKSSIKKLHNPENEDDLSPDTKTRARLAYDELLANQLALAIIRSKARKQKGIAFKGDSSARQKILQSLPFELTKSQRECLQEIYEDMETPSRMLRLVQGDVGSGKTVVALLAMANVIESGFQAALMAPTDILARQHYESLADLAAQAGIKVEILTGRDKGKSRANKLESIASGEAKIIIGTHALFQEEVKYQKLGLAVIDEQHRFGVHQRLGLAAKGEAVDMLVMTATPIPRTLMMSAYGDLDVSRLYDKPPGRKPIQTIVVNQDRLSEVVTSLSRKIKEGAKIYWVCPLVEESELLDLPAATDRHQELASFFGE
ncbi:MAG: ATP-dependent DNA helicase RecG, partial [Alphaproteobacteria bacterium]|nr:ATP-dependent DNA helicase RecG [Alphaproteobacteria bacterium]